MRKRLFISTSRTLVVLLAVIMLTSFSIDATDTLSGSQSALSILADRLTSPSCPAGMVKVDGTEKFCIDMYEVSAGEGCEITHPASVFDTINNLTKPNCKPVTKSNVLPWRFVTHTQAMQLCARAGKRLPTSEAWYEAALGTVDAANVCTVSGSLTPTGQAVDCKSGSGAYDMIGNVWEYVKGEVEDGMFAGQSLPTSGYVAQVTQSGMIQTTSDVPQALYNEDYFWSQASGNFVMMRGGFYNGKSDAGLYSIHAHIASDFASAAIGFRCVSSL